MITPRRTRLVRVPDLHAFRRSIIHLVQDGAPVVIVPTGGAARQLARTLGPTSAVVVTREELYERLHRTLPGAARRLTLPERDSIAQAAAREAKRSLDQAHAPVDVREGDDPSAQPAVPFRLRPGLVAEMLRFYDQLRRQSQRLERFHELIEEALGGADDRGTHRLLSQTRFLTEAFRAYERRVAASGAWDEHTLRERLMREPTNPLVTHLIVTVADWIAEPDGLFIGDFDLFARMPGLARIDLVCTEQVLGSGFHERIHSWWPGLEELDVRDVLGPTDAPQPVLDTPSDPPGRLWFTVRDREDELMAVAQHIKAARREATENAPAPPLDRTAVVYKRPLPYLYLASDTLAAAGIPYDIADARPLAGEPVVATVDLVLDAVESGFSRDALIALLSSPHLAVADPPLLPSAVRALDTALRVRGYLGDRAKLADLASSWEEDASHAALLAAVSVANDLAPLGDAGPASGQLRRVVAFLGTRLRPLEAHDRFGPREQRARTALLGLLAALADAHAAFHDPVWTIAELAAAVRRWIEEETFADEPTGEGVQLLNDRAVRYGSYDDITIVGLIESEWPERQARNIFYPSGLLKALGWPSEHTRRSAADARFVDLLGTAARRVAVSTITLDDEAIVMRSMQLDEIPRARLSAVPSRQRDARITVDEALARAPVDLRPLAETTREWATLRQRRPPGTEPRYHGDVGPRPSRAWSVSALESYLACPFKFFAQHVLRLDEEPEDSDVMNPRQQGQFVHKVFEEFFAVWQRRGGGTISPATLDAARQVFATVVEAQLEALSGAEAGLERTRLLGSSAAAGLGEAVLRMEAERPTRVIERRLEARLDGPITIETEQGPRVVELKGKTDRIDLLEDGTFRVIDYKLGWPPPRARALQLPIYAIAAQQLLQRTQARRWELGEAVYLAFKGPKRVVPLFSQLADRDQVLVDAQQRVADILDAIERGEFPPRPDDVFLCETCSFAAVCRKDYVE
ncbi:MAG: PD-(D/E)XK nuclease family protein [Vicinamibacterales bacterium]